MCREQSGTLLVFSDKYPQYPLVCYVPSPRQAENGIVVLRQGTLLRAVFLTPEQVLWEVTVDGWSMDPRGVVYSPRHRALLVCDGSNQQIVVMDPERGKARETVQFDRRKIRGIPDLCLCGDHAVMLHDQTGSSIKISFLHIK